MVFLLQREFSAIERRDVILAITLGAVVMAVSVFRIEVSREAISVNNCVLGADTVSIWRYLEEGNFLGLRVHKHALAVVLIALLAQPLIWLGISQALAATLALSLVQACAAVLAFAYFRRAGNTKAVSAGLTLLVLSTLGVATHFGMAESYGVTLLAICIACLLLPVVAEKARQDALVSASVAGAIGAGLALANAPAAAFLLVYFACLLKQAEVVADLRKFALCILVPLAFVLLAVVAPAVAAEGDDGLVWHGDYLERFASFSHFIDPQVLADFLATSFVFSFVAPYEFLRCRFIFADLVQFGARPLHLAAYLAMASLLVVSLVRAVRSSERTETFGLLAAASAILLFYLYFNPDEALLYSPQWLIALFFASAPGVPRMAIWVWLAAVLGLLVNVPTLHHEKTSDPEVCCPHPPGSMMERELPSVLIREGSRHNTRGGAEQ